MTSKQAWVLALASLASFMMALDSLVVTTALSTIRQDLTASVEELEWTVNAYNLTFAVLPLSLTLISAMFPAQQRGKAMGLYLGITGLATISGPFIGGAIAEGLAWQWIFWLNLPIGVVAILLTAGVRCRAGDRLRALGAAYEGADSADAVLPVAGVRDGEPGELPRVRVAVRHDVLSRAVLPDRAR